MATLEGPDQKGQPRDLVSVRDLTREKIDTLLDNAQRQEKQLNANEEQTLATNTVLATLFYEPSTRTRLSFESAMERLGGSTISVTEASASSAAKGESLADTVRVISGYADAIVLRHPREGSARLASRFATVPVVNAGDGAGEHPTQTLTDLYTIRKATGQLDDVRIVLGGDLRYGRTVHSLVLALGLYEADLVLAAPTSEFDLPEDLKDEARDRGATITQEDDLEQAVHDADILYQTRLQTERFEGQGATPHRITIDTIREAPPRLKILHPLPRIDEIAREVDETEHAAYFEQAHNGLPVRMAVLETLLGGSS